MRVVFFLLSECYEPQYYCIAKVDCGFDGVIALISGTSESSLTTNLQSGKTDTQYYKSPPYSIRFNHHYLYMFQ